MMFSCILNGQQGWACLPLSIGWKEYAWSLESLRQDPTKAAQYVQGELCAGVFELCKASMDHQACVVLVSHVEGCSTWEQPSTCDWLPLVRGAGEEDNLIHEHDSPPLRPPNQVPVKLLSSQVILITLFI
jgi:hypothetical protein